jgi:hypothetical protein
MKPAFGYEKDVMVANQPFKHPGRIEMQCGNPDAGVTANRLAVSNIRYVAYSY